MAGLWSNPSEFPRLPDEEEIGGEMNLVGPGGSSGYGVDEDTGMFGPGRTSGMNLVGPGGSPGYGVVEDTGMFGPGRSSGFGQIDDDMSNDGLGQLLRFVVVKCREVPVQVDQSVCLETQDVWVMVMTYGWVK